MENKNENVEQMKLSFAAIDPYYTSNIIRATETEIKGRDMVEWGERNMYPNYLCDLTQDVTLLRTIINGIANYVVGENVKFKSAFPFNSDCDLEDLVRNLALDYGRYGGFALNVVRNKMGKIAGVYYLDFKNIRSNKKNTIFYYSEDWKKSYGRVKCLTYPVFHADGQEASSIFYYKNNRNSVYPLPVYGGDGTLAAETQKAISEFHLNNISNGFAGSFIINFNNGKPNDALQEEIEDNLNEKFGGYQNAGRMLVSFNDTKEQEVTISKIDADNFADKYNALSKSVKQEIYSSFSAHPVLFGLPTEQSGFNDQDFMEAFKLFNKTQILPIQKIIKKAFEKIYGEQDILEFEPFNIDWGEDVNNEVVK